MSSPTRSRSAVANDDRSSSRFSRMWICAKRELAALAIGRRRLHQGQQVVGDFDDRAVRRSRGCDPAQRRVRSGRTDRSESWPRPVEEHAAAPAPRSSRCKVSAGNRTDPAQRAVRMSRRREGVAYRSPERGRRCEDAERPSLRCAPPTRDAVREARPERRSAGRAPCRRRRSIVAPADARSQIAARGDRNERIRPPWMTASAAAACRASASDRRRRRSRPSGAPSPPGGTSAPDRDRAKRSRSPDGDRRTRRSVTHGRR